MTAEEIRNGVDEFIKNKDSFYVSDIREEFNISSESSEHVSLYKHLKKHVNNGTIQGVKQNGDTLYLKL